MAIIEIDPAGDLIVEISEKSTSTYSGQVTTKTAQFNVRREVLTKASQPLLQMLVSPHWSEASQILVFLSDGHLITTEIWLCILHKTQAPYDVPLYEMWHLVEAIDYYDLDVTMFNAWFATYYEKKTSQMLEARELLFPTWRFNHARGFANWTKYLAYENTGHIMEKNPTKLYNYHLPSRLIQQLNAAKGRLRTVLHKGLFVPCNRLFAARCSCKEKTLYDYQKHLYDIDVWPLEEVFTKNSMTTILDNLGKFSYEAPLSACAGSCRQDYKGMVSKITEEVRDYFDGLCLDCLDRSKPKSGDVDMDYWQHHKLKINDFVEGCRIQHKQPTWYFSFNGRKEDRDRLAKEMKSRRERRHRYLDEFYDEDD